MAPVSLIPAQKYSNTTDSNQKYLPIIFAGKINPDQSCHYRVIHAPLLTKFF